MDQDDRRAKTLVWIFGPPAVGKMTVGRELSELTGFPLFHNHLSIEAVLPIFPYGSPPFNRIVRQLREQVFAEAARSELTGLIFTYVWAFDLASDRKFVEHQKSLFESYSGRTVFVELIADLGARLARNESEPRISEKRSKRDRAASRQRLIEMDKSYVLDSGGDFPFPDYLRIDNTALQPRVVAKQIAEHFALV